MKNNIKYFIVLLLPIFINILFSQNSLKVVTYNIQGMKPGTNPDTRLLHIIQKLLELDPDIIGLQEINEDKTGDDSDNQARRIADSLTAHFGIQYNVYYEQTHDAWDNKFREFVGIITKLPVVDQGFQTLTPGMFPRKVLWNYIEISLGKINFFTSHLSFNSGATRKIQVDEILNYAGLLNAIKPNVANIITGDFNDTPDSTSIKKLTNGSYWATFTEANPGLPGYTMPSGSAFRKNNYIFMNKFSQLQIDTSYIIMDEPYSGVNYCSDHLGIMTVFSDTATIDTTTVGIKTNHNKTLDSFILYQNYPNPFNPTTTIEYTVSTTPQSPPNLGWEAQQGRYIQLKIFNIIGNEVATLVDEPQLAGKYSVQFNIWTDLESVPTNGIYFYKLQIGSNSLTKKMLLMK